MSLLILSSAAPIYYWETHREIWQLIFSSILFLECKMGSHVPKPGARDCTVRDGIEVGALISIGAIISIEGWNPLRASNTYTNSGKTHNTHPNQDRLAVSKDRCQDHPIAYKPVLRKSTARAI